MRLFTFLTFLLGSMTVFAQADRTDEFQVTDYGSRFDILFGFSKNVVGGSAADHIYGGGGLKFDVMFYSSRWGGGTTMSFHNNRSRKENGVTTLLPQNRSLITGYAGAVIARLFEERPMGQFSTQLEVCYSIQSVMIGDKQFMQDPVLAKGFSPGLIVNYAMNLGKGRMSKSFYSPAPAMVRRYINFHIGIRPMIFDVRQASGVRYEAGISFRLGMREVLDFKLK